jgi:polysaccharide chain length determinant protein (PEP-CTERM system associated)
MGAGFGISYTLPPQYVSRTQVLIEQQKVPENYVKPVVNEDLNERLASMKEQILSRSSIEPIITKFNLYPASKYSMDDRVDLTRKAIGIYPMRSDLSHGMPGFALEFKAADPHIAQQVCGEITSLFVSANLSARQESAEGTTDFLKQQLAEAKNNLDEQDAKLAAFEQKNIGRLPGQTVHLGDMSVAMGSANESTLQALTTQLDAATQTVSRLQQDVTFLETMIAQQAQESARTNPATGTSEDTHNTQLKDAITQQKELEALYTPDHPDVIAIKRRITNLRAETARSSAEQERSATAVGSHDTPQLQQLKAQLRAENQSLAAAKQEQARLDQQVGAYEAKIEASPMLEEEYKQVTRDHETALQFYNTLLTKMNESSMATALEHRQQGEQFRVMDVPNLPEEPSFPNHRAFASGGLACGLGLGLLLAGLLEYRDTSLHNARDVLAFTKLPTLAVFSYIGDLAGYAPPRERRRLISRTSDPSESVRK